MIDCYYTLMPPQFEEQEDTESVNQLVCYKGVHLYVRPYDATHYQVMALCTTNPGNYLRRDVRPGTLIPFLHSKF